MVLSLSFLFAVVAGVSVGCTIAFVVYKLGLAGDVTWFERLARICVFIAGCWVTDTVELNLNNTFCVGGAYCGSPVFWATRYVAYGITVVLLLLIFEEMNETPTKVQK